MQGLKPPPTRRELRLPPCSGHPRSVLGLAALAAVPLFLAALFLWGANFREPAPGDGLPGGDYVAFFLAGKVLQAGEQDRLYDFDFQKAFQHDPDVVPYHWAREEFTLFVNPPFFAWLCLPLAYLPFKAGAMAWAAALTGLLLGSVSLLTRSHRPAVEHFGWALLAALFYKPLLLAVYTCQPSAFGLAVVSGTYLLLRVRRPFAAGLVLALMVYKPQLAVVIGLAMVLKGQWRFVGGAALGGGMLALASLAVSPAATADYLMLGPRIGNWLDMPGMELNRACSWAGFWRLIAGGRWPPEVVTVATVASCLATLVPLAWLFRGTLDAGAPRFRVRYAALVLATVALSPYVLSYDLTLLLVPMFLLLAHRSQSGAAEGASRWLAVLAALLYGVASVSETVAAATGVQPIVPLIAVALAWLDRRAIPAAVPMTGRQTVWPAAKQGSSASSGAS